VLGSGSSSRDARRRCIVGRVATPHIVVLDGYTLNPGDLSWQPLAALGELRVHERTRPEEIHERARDADVVLTNKTPLGRASVAALPRLRYVGVLATGTNILDLDALAERGVVVCNARNYGASSVAEHTLALMLEGTKHLSRHAAAVRSGAWARQPDFSLSVAPLGLLAGKRLGIVGLGGIGRRVAELGRAFEMQVCAAQRSPERPPPEGVEWRDLDAVFATSDVVSLHCPLTAETRHLVNARRLALMKATAFLVNTARGGLIDEAALAQALREERIAGAYLDVLDAEPPPADHPLVALPRCFVTPHVAWASREARERLLAITVDNDARFLEGRPLNVVVPASRA
jgi:glycerate dehydrogenase